jgi:hypothetical protein
MHYTKQSAQWGGNNECTAECFIPALGTSLEKLGVDFTLHSATFVVSHQTQLDVLRALNYARRLDPLCGRLIVVRGEHVSIEWQERTPSIPLPVSDAAPKRKRKQSRRSIPPSGSGKRKRQRRSR